MKLTKMQIEALNWIEEIAKKTDKDISLLYVDDFWRVCPYVLNDDRKSGTVHVGKVNGKVWNSLIKKGYFTEEKYGEHYTDYRYIYNRDMKTETL